ncbi:MAG: adenosylmethionine--8-amino-7-oxononanoate transaminase [Desulfobacterota bacterium]|nr:adenosylmethionine--8-amino-7-oxononanoate transaminase [Thermodesulfobacteriota bacterium]
MAKKKTLTTTHNHLRHIDQTCLWHPFTQMQEYARTEPLIIERGKGSYLYDHEGRRYIDGVSSLWVLVHGHGTPAIDRAMISQIRRLSHSTLLGLTHEPAIRLAEKLVAITPSGLTKVFYSDNGSTAVEIGLKIAFQYWQQVSATTRKKKRFLSLTNAYHGDTLGAVSVGGIDLFHRIYRPLLFRAYKAPSPYCYRCAFKLSYPGCGMACLERFAEILKKHHHELAACIMEPLVQGAAGMIVFPRGYLREARALCARYDVLFIADEVAVGFGRTGRMFACEHERVRPDLMAVAKGITGGTLPLAATLATDRIYEAFLGKPEECKTFYHGHTYTGNPIACAAALANLELFERTAVLEHLQPKIGLLKKRLEHFWNLAHVGDIRQQGFMVGIELVAHKKTKARYPLAAQMGHRVILAARARGVIIRPLGDVIVLMPPLSISVDELSTLLDVVYDSIKTVTER